MKGDKVPENAQCTRRGCTDRSTVILERNGKPHCRPHGLAEALRFVNGKQSEIRPIPEEQR